jgi:hypothetical protein
MLFPIVPGSAELIPDWAGINSRLDLLREFACTPLISANISRPHGGDAAKIGEIPV